MSLALADSPLTEAQYLEIEAAHEERREFFEGEMFAMGGGTWEHSLISSNLSRVLGNRLSDGRCLVVDKDLKIKVELTGLITYPDVPVIRGPPRFADEKRHVLLNPTLLAEVLSDSTEQYDRTTKFDHYRLIPSLQGYLLVSQREPRLELFARGEDGLWTLQVAVGLDASLAVPFLGIELPLREIYAKVEFPPPNPLSPPGPSHRNSPSPPSP